MQYRNKPPTEALIKCGVRLVFQSVLSYLTYSQMYAILGIDWKLYQGKNSTQYHEIWSMYLTSLIAVS